mmetsp:Transcript_12423/g.31534  ORF Transcript_12423/g.31534 Transcript_12423/m.31534 type:complete len:217 (-) Transcript_12423:50-700(-)
MSCKRRATSWSIALTAARVTAYCSTGSFEMSSRFTWNMALKVRHPAGEVQEFPDRPLPSVCWSATTTTLSPRSFAFSSTIIWVDGTDRAARTDHNSATSSHAALSPLPSRAAAAATSETRLPNASRLNVIESFASAGDSSLAAVPCPPSSCTCRVLPQHVMLLGKAGCSEGVPPFTGSRTPVGALPMGRLANKTSTPSPPRAGCFCWCCICSVPGR